MKTKFEPDVSMRVRSGRIGGGPAPCAAAPIRGCGGIGEAEESLRDQSIIPPRSLTGSGRTPPIRPPLAQRKTGQTRPPGLMALKCISNQQPGRYQEPVSVKNSPQKTHK